MYSSNSLTGNENPSTVLRTPDDLSPEHPCVECGFRFNKDELSRKGVCADCAETVEQSCMCDDCQLEWTQIGLPTECPFSECHSKNVTTDDKFLDSVIKEKQTHKSAKTFAAIVTPAIALFAYLVISSIR